MKKADFVNPVILALMLAAALFVPFGCSGGESVETVAGSDGHETLTHGGWTVEYDAEGLQSGAVTLAMTDSSIAQTDSLHYDDPDNADSLVFRRSWSIGGGRQMVFTVTVPGFSDQSRSIRIQRIMNEASLTPPQGLRRVYLSDRTFSEIDEDRGSVPVEPPPEVNHYLTISYNAGSNDSCLVIRDSVVVDFTMSNADSILLEIEQGFSRDETVFRPDSSGFSTRTFTMVLEMNRLYTDLDGIVLGHARLTSAYLTGYGFYPLSDSPQNYTARFLVPDSILVWTPLEHHEGDTWVSGSGGINGGLPVALGTYSTGETGPGHSFWTLSAGQSDTLDAFLIELLSEVLHETLEFPSADFAFTEVLNPDGDMVIPVFGGVFFSRGSMEPLAEADQWDDMISRGRIPPGCGIVFSAARGMLMQSLKLDPVLCEMLVSWMPLKYYAWATGDTDGLAVLRECYMRYYLFHTESAAMGTESETVEYSIADPLLAGSRLRPIVTGGKGVIILEYLDHLGLLDNLSGLLLRTSHSWSGNYWSTVSSYLLYNDKVEDEYSEVLRKLFYLAGIPQLRVTWRQDEETVLFQTGEIQPGVPFDLPLDSIPCLIVLQDTSLVRTVFTDNGQLQCLIDAPPGRDPLVTSLDLDPESVLPVDIIYERIRD